MEKERIIKLFIIGLLTLVSIVGLSMYFSYNNTEVSLRKQSEAQKGKVEGIIAAVYQSAFGEDAYPTLEEKAVNLLYFMIKDHPYADGCKRIAASLFLEFLGKQCTYQGW